MKEVIMPRLGLNMETGIITKWYIGVGDRVEAGEKLCEIETEKTIHVIESECSGTVHRLLEEEGAEVEVLGVIAEIEEIGE